MTIDIQQLSADVQFNCDVADAGFAGNYTMCTYLLKMREFYRWSADIKQSSSLPMGSVSDWVEEKEAHWQSLQTVDFRPIVIDGIDHEPFDVEGINQKLAEEQLVYGAGYGRGCRPQFYLADLECLESYPAYDVVISAHEHARDLSAPVAMAQGRTIYVRRESIRRMVWEHIESWRWRKSPAHDPLAYALSGLNLQQNPEDALDQLTDLQVEYAIHHEVGEVVASSILGAEWADMLMQHPGSRLEILARAIKDHLADALVTLPEMIQSRNDTAIHLYFANLTALRKELFPQLTVAYEEWRNSGFAVLSNLVGNSHQHWLDQANRMLDDYKAGKVSSTITDEQLESFQPLFTV